MKLMKSASWPMLSRTADASLLWGECQGSGQRGTERGLIRRQLLDLLLGQVLGHPATNAVLAAVWVGELLGTPGL